MFKKVIMQDLAGLFVLLLGCLILGLCINQMRFAPLPLAYVSPQSRLTQVVQQFGHLSTTPVVLDKPVGLAEMQSICLTRAALILDARPKIFYRIGHIPSAISLPRDDFGKQYQAVQANLIAHRNSSIVVYCSGGECHDSQMVADALRKLGYPHVRLFQGGWSDWEGSRLPEEIQSAD
jgi:3-mercaptopyruvate sulfurtransferase SseA